MRSPVRYVLPLTALLLSGATSAIGAEAKEAGAKQAGATPSGPAADYPVVVGEPYTIGSTTWTPSNQLNYDAVGYAQVNGGGLAGVSGAHKTLPLPSYVEVTSLESGRTILVRLVQRGPMVNDALIALSSQAAVQLGITSGARAAVRVRRVNPPEFERSALRTGGTAPLRMDTPESLLKVLRRKLAEQSPLMPSPSTPSRMPFPTPGTATDKAGGPAAAMSPSVSQAAPTAQKTGQTAAAASKSAAAAPSASVTTTREIARAGTHVVQVATFSTAERARKVAAQLGGHVTAAGRYWRVRLGPFKSSGEAAPALEKAKTAGYSDARIQRAD